MFTLIFNQLLKMLFIMLLAYFCYKIGLITQEGNRTLSNLLLMVVNPCLIITVYQTPYDPALIRGLMISFAAAAAAHILGILMAHFLIPAGMIAYPSKIRNMRLNGSPQSIPTADLSESL